MKIYNYNKKGYFTNESDAKIDLLETNIKNETVYLLPSNATFKVVLEEKENKIRRFINNEWIYEDIILEEVVTLEDSIENKIKELEIYHISNSEIREMKINDYFILSLSGNGRALIAEQIQSLDQQIKLNVITEESATFEYFYNGGSIEITLVQLRQLYIFMLNVVNTNYGVYKAHIHAIKNLSTIEEVEAYDFTVNYLKNQNLDLV